MTVLVLSTISPDQPPARRVMGEFDVSEAADEIARLTPGAKCARVRGDLHEVLSVLDDCRPDVVFNLCEAPLGRPDLEAHVAAILEWSGIRFTGAGSETLALCRRKDRTKAVLAAAGVAVPRVGGFPCIVKPADEDGSTGIDWDSVCADASAVERVRAHLGGPVIIEEFLPGTEYVISLWGKSDPEFVSIGEVFFANGLRLFTYAAKWHLDSPDFANSRLHYHTEIDPPLRAALAEAGRGTWRAVEARGYLRLDVRLDACGVPRVLDVNPNADVTPGMGMHRAVTEAGWSWEHFVRQQIEWAEGASRSSTLFL